MLDRKSARLCCNTKCLGMINGNWETRNDRSGDPGLHGMGLSQVPAALSHWLEIAHGCMAPMVIRGPLVLTDPVLYQVRRVAHHDSQGLPFRGCDWGEIQLPLGSLILGHGWYSSFLLKTLMKRVVALTSSEDGCGVTLNIICRVWTLTSRPLSSVNSWLYLSYSDTVKGSLRRWSSGSLLFNTHYLLLPSCKCSPASWSVSFASDNDSWNAPSCCLEWGVVDRSRCYLLITGP